MLFKKSKAHMSEILNGYLFILPNFIGFLLFAVIPIFFSMILAFMKWDGIQPMSYVGLKNFITLFQSETFKISIKNNLLYTLGTVPVSIFLALSVAILVNNKIKGIGIYKSILFFPNVTSWVAIALVFGAIFNQEMGPINSFLRSIGVDSPPGWFSSSEWAIWGTIIAAIWKAFGYYLILYIAGLKGISGLLYEAADIEGASTIQKVRHVTLPMLTPTTLFVTTMAIIWSFQVFDQIYVLTKGGPGTSTNVLVFLIIKQAFEYGRLGYASAISWILFSIIFVFAIIQYSIQEKRIKSIF